MNFNVYVFGLRVMYQILNDLERNIIITKNRSVKKVKTVIQQLVLHPDDLREQVDAATYSASAMDVDTVCCFVHCHDTSLSPRN